MNQLDKNNSELANKISPVKCVVVIVDGLGDLPVPELNDKTPLEAANTPLLDQLAGAGRYGLVDPIKPGEVPNTHTGTGLLMGLLPEQAIHLKRGPVEAAGAGQVLAAGDIAMRVNFATLESREGELLVIDRRAGRITSSTAELAALLKNIDLGDGIRGSLLSTDQHRGVLVLSGPGLDSTVSNTDPGNCSLPVALRMCTALKPEAELTAEKINRFIDEAHRRLVDHPINLARINAGQLPANGVITRGAGQQLHLDNVLRDSGVNTAVVSGCNTVLGVARIFGFNTITDPRFTASVNTDLDGKMEAVASALLDHDLVYVHLKAPDNCSHDLKPLAKRDFIQRLDQSMLPLQKNGLVMAVAADHSTNSNTGFHTADPIPALICQMGSTQAFNAIKFGESACEQGSMERQSGHEFLLNVLHTAAHQVG